jgi:triosephosphate isomerase
VRTLLAGNWKMNPLAASDAAALAGGVAEAARARAERVETALFPPFPWLTTVAAALAGSGVGLGAQDCSWELSGAYTGEVSPAMLAGWCQWVIVGHSERRIHLGESDETVARKLRRAVAVGLRVILCVGERADQHEAGETGSVVSSQVRAALSPEVAAAGDRLVLAYEPVWAIGSGRNADPEDAGHTIRLVREAAGEALGGAAAQRPRVLYGGSVNAANVASYVTLAECDGCLIGGASLKAEEFSRMIEVVAGVSRA